MRFNFETAKRGKCLIEVAPDDGDTLATIWHGPDRNHQATTFARATTTLPDFYEEASPGDRAELLARLVIHHFEAFGGFPGRDDLETELSHTWDGQISPVP